MGYTAIVDYGVGNLKSVSNALAYLGLNPLVTGDAGEIEGADALILPGGAGSWVLRDTPEVIHLVKKMHEAGKLVAAICAAPIVLAKAGLVKDKNVTAYPAQDVYRELNEAGARIVKDENVVLDGNMLTANGPGAAMLFGYSIGEYLGEDLQVAQLKEQMCYTGL